MFHRRAVPLGRLVVALVSANCGIGAAQVLDDSCLVTVGGQTAQVNPDGSFTIANVAAPDASPADFISDDPVRLIGTCVRDGQIAYVVSDCFRFSNNQSFSFSEDDLNFLDAPPLVIASISASFATPTLTAIGQTIPIDVVALDSDGNASVPDPGFDCMTFRSSNKAIVTVDADGLVTAVGPGTALVTVTAQGAASVAQITVSLGDPLTTVVGIVVEEDGTPVPGATVTLQGIGGSDVTDADGAFTVAGVATQAGDLTVVGSVVMDGVTNVGVSAATAPISGAFTDVGLVMVSNRIKWVSATSGSWHMASNWGGGFIPGTGNVAVIDVPGADITVTYSTGTTNLAAIECGESLALTSGTLSIDEDSFASKALTLSGGTITGSGSLSVSGSFLYTGGALSGSGNLTIEPGATWSASTGFCPVWSRPFINHGTGNWSACVTISNTTLTNAADGIINFVGPNTNLIFAGGSSSFVNDGILNADNSVTIHPPLTNNGTLNAKVGILTLSGSGSVNNGLMDGDAGSVITFSNSTTLAAGSTLITEGSVTVPGTTDVLGTYDCPTTTVTGTLNFNTGSPIELPTFVASAGLLGGTDDVSVTSSMTWTGTQLTGTGSFTLEPGSTWSATSGFCGLWSRSFINHGTGNWSACVTISNTTLTNAADGIINFVGPNTNLIFAGGSSSFVNEGILNADNSVTIHPPLTNNGTLNANVGIVTFSGSGSVNNGLIDGDAGSTITFSDSTTLAAGSTLITEGAVTFAANAGTVSALGSYESPSTTLTSGTANFNTGETQVLPTLVGSGGTLGGSDHISVTSSFTWTGTALTGTGDIAIEPGVTWSFTSGSCKTLSRPFINHGTGNWSACVTISNTTLTNAADGIINFVGPNTNLIFAGGSSSFVNDGMLNANSSVTFNAPLTNSATGRIQGAGTLNVSGSIFSQNGIVSPGTSPGILTVTGNLPNTATAATNIEIGGLVQGTEYDKLTVSGIATLDGTLNITLINGFQPQLGNTFTIMTFGSFNGAFDTITGTDLGGLKFNTVVGSTSIILEVVPSAGFHQPRATHR